MKAKYPVAVASAAIILYCMPAELGAARLPGKQSEAPYERYIGDSDPWVPDTRDPNRIVRLPDRTSVSAVEGGAPPSAASQSTWYGRLLRLIRVLRLGGAVR